MKRNQTQEKEDTMKIAMLAIVLAPLAAIVYYALYYLL